tara:strand:+ start:1395 stop:2423 length:1029 start_codon:yes stop_codon:yes gene_type:complete
MTKTCLITGAAGFIGFHLSLRMIKDGYNVIGFDNVNNYYPQSLKFCRLEKLKEESKANNLRWNFIKGDLLEKDLLDDLIDKNNPDYVIHLAAQAGVRHSIKNPFTYINSNIVGFNNLIDKCARKNIKHFIYASSSSVYGGNSKIPFSEEDPVDHPISLYAATKRSNELIAHSYSHLYNMSCTGIRFFTVYGPWGRPDMAPMIFAEAILNKKPLKIFNKGNMSRDFTYINDVVEMLHNLVEKPPKANKDFKTELLQPSVSWAPHRIFNLGNGNPVPLMKFINLLEKELKIDAIKDFQDMQQGDVEKTFANMQSFEKNIGTRTKTSLEKGIKEFILWFKNYYKY